MLKFKGKAKNLPNFLLRIKLIHGSKTTMGNICEFINSLLGDSENVGM